MNLSIVIYLCHANYPLFACHRFFPLFLLSSHENFCQPKRFIYSLLRWVSKLVFSCIYSFTFFSFQRILVESCRINWFSSVESLTSMKDTVRAISHDREFWSSLKCHIGTDCVVSLKKINVSLRTDESVENIPYQLNSYSIVEWGVHFDHWCR